MVGLTWEHSPDVVIWRPNQGWAIHNGLTRVSNCCYWLSAGPYSAGLLILWEAGPSFFRVVSHHAKKARPFALSIIKSLHVSHFLAVLLVKASHKGMATETYDLLGTTNIINYRKWV